jgi:hypothetical protein
MIQELQVLNVQMRIITEQNVDQLLNLSYQSRNIDKLLHLPIDSDEAKNDIKAIVTNYKKQTDIKNKLLSRERTEYDMRQQQIQIQISNPVPQGMTEEMYRKQEEFVPPTEWNTTPVDETLFERTL